jgi:hypothetical protein
MHNKQRDDRHVHEKIYRPSLTLSQLRSFCMVSALSGVSENRAVTNLTSSSVSKSTRAPSSKRYMISAMDASRSSERYENLSQEETYAAAAEFYSLASTDDPLAWERTRAYLFRTFRKKTLQSVQHSAELREPVRFIGGNVR